MSRRCRPGLDPKGTGSTSTVTGGSSGGGLPSCAPSNMPPECLNTIDITSFMTLDDHVALNGLGSDGDELPVVTLSFGPTTYNDFPYFRSDDEECGYPAFVGRSHSGEVWEVITTDPPGSETYHLRFGPGGTGTPGVIFASDRVCKGNNRPYTSLCNPGDQITVSAQGKVDSTSSSPQITFAISFYDEDGNFIDDTTNSTALTTSYATYDLTETAPAGTHTVEVQMGTSASNQTSTRDFGDLQFLRVP